MLQEVDGDIWSAVLHVEVFLKATAPDSATTDEQMESRVLSALGSVAGRGHHPDNVGAGV